MPNEISKYEPSRIRTSRSASTARPDGTEVTGRDFVTERRRYRNPLRKRALDLCYTSRMTSLADDTQWMDATDQAGLVAKGDATPVELLEAAMGNERIERLDPSLNAVVIRWFDHADVAADPDLPSGPFRGVPFLLKDLFATYAGQRISNGNVALKNANTISPIDTTLVARYHAAGLVIAGRTNSPELGSVPTTNHWLGGPLAIRGTPHARREDSAADPLHRTRRAWCRSPMPVMVVDRFAFRRPAAASSVSNPARVGSRLVRLATKAVSAWSTA